MRTVTLTVAGRIASRRRDFSGVLGRAQRQREIAGCLLPPSRHLRRPFLTSPLRIFRSHISYARPAMADAMDVDVPAAEPKGKTKEDAKGDKKRFEVKKVRPSCS